MNVITVEKEKVVGYKGPLYALILVETRTYKFLVKFIIKKNSVAISRHFRKFQVHLNSDIPSFEI